MRERVDFWLLWGRPRIGQTAPRVVSRWRRGESSESNLSPRWLFNEQNETLMNITGTLKKIAD